MHDLRSSVANVFAIGDVAGPPMLAHKASHEGVQVVEMLAGLPVHPVDASYIPNCTYCTTAGGLDRLHGGGRARGRL